MPDFADPWAFALLLAPLLVYALAPPAATGGAALRAPEGVARRIVDAARASGGSGGVRRYLGPAAIWLLLVIALAGPRAPAPVAALPMSGRDLILALDLSGSMIRDDFHLDGETITRLDAVKSVGASFARGRAGDRIGLVVFGSEAYFAAAPTFDAAAVAEAIEGMTIGISGRATNIGDGLGVALKRLEQSDAAAKVVILLSDGANNAGAATPRDAARLAQEMGVRVHTIALGPKSVAEAAPGERGVVDAATLSAMAEIGGGRMFRVRTTEDLAEVIREIDALEPTARAGLAAEVRRELWIWPAGLALAGCLLIGWRTSA